MNKRKALWESLSALEKGMLLLRDGGCVCVLLSALLAVAGIPEAVSAAIWLLPAVAVSQAVLSWKRSRATAVFFVAAVVFFFFVYFISRG